jgi:hypothetical protein
MKSLAAALALVITTVVVAAAADVSGTWNVEGEVVGYSVKFACTLKQAGDTLSGTATIQGKDSPLTGTVKDRTVTFQFDVDHEGQTYTNVYTGTVGENGVLEGSIEVAGQLGSFTAKKQ